MAGQIYGEWPRQVDRHAKRDSVTSDNGGPKSPIKYRAPSLDIGKVRTRSLAGPFSAAVVFERDYQAPQSDDDIIIVTVRVTNSFRKSSVDGCDELPSRPAPRSFLRRMSTRWHGPIDDDKYKAIKMPRGEYKRHFRRDKDRNYAGTETERQWSLDDLMREFGVYQDLPLGSILC